MPIYVTTLQKKVSKLFAFSRVKLPGFSFSNTLSGTFTYFRKSSGCVGEGSQLMTNFDAKMKSKVKGCSVLPSEIFEKKYILYS